MTIRTRKHVAFVFKGGMLFRNVGINNPATQHNTPEDLSPHKTKAAKTASLNNVSHR
jgi:hypothetical protein